MSHDALAGQKLREAIPKYAAKTIDAEYDYVGVLDCFVPDEQAAQVLGHLLIDAVFRYLLASASDLYDASSGNMAALDEALDSFLAKKTRLTGQTLKNFRRILKQAVLTKKNASRPKREVAKRLKKKQADHFCYLCGCVINEEEHLDHVWPASAGGGTSKENLRRTHAECDAAKADLATSADSAVGRFAYSQLPTYLENRPDSWWPTTINTEDEFNRISDALRAAAMRVAVVHRQEFRCTRCGVEFRLAGEVSLEKRNIDEPWWFPNTVATCSECKLGEKHANI